MPKATINTQQFIDKLTTRLSEENNWRVEKEKPKGVADLVVENSHSGKKVYIEFMDPGGYGQLPMASIISLHDQKDRLSPTDDLLLIAFGRIPELLASKLDQFGILAIAKPSSIDDVVGKVQMAMAS